MKTIAVENLTKSFGENTLFSHLSFTVPAGQISAICGPSGCGKTTLFRLLCGLETPDEGTILIPDDCKLAYVFQEPRLLPHATVYQNLAMLYDDRSVAKAAIPQWLQRVGMAGCEDLYPHELSGGMKSRVSLARALCVEPDILLLDEPFNGLDEATKDEMIALVKQYTEGKTALIITHQKEELEKLDAIEIEIAFLKSEQRKN